MGGFEAKTRGHKRSLKTGGFLLKREKKVCDIEMPLQMFMFNSIFVVDVCFQHLVFVLFNFILFE